MNCMNTCGLFELLGYVGCTLLVPIIGVCTGMDLDGKRDMALGMGLGSVLWGQIVTMGVLEWKTQLYLYRNQSDKKAWNERYVHIQKHVQKHIMNIEGLLLIGGYLMFTWKMGWMPLSYERSRNGIQWINVGGQLLLQDFLQYWMHRWEHRIKWLYRNAHMEHHKHREPVWWDAFDGTCMDTTVMILVPLFFTAQTMRQVNVWSYMTFGTIYANWLTCIHSNTELPWESFFTGIGFGTSRDHLVHHRLYAYNFGHMFMYWDKWFGTYYVIGSVRTQNTRDI